MVLVSKTTQNCPFLDPIFCHRNERARQGVEASHTPAKNDRRIEELRRSRAEPPDWALWTGRTGLPPRLDGGDCVKSPDRKHPSSLASERSSAPHPASQNHSLAQTANHRVPLPIAYGQGVFLQAESILVTNLGAARAFLGCFANLDRSTASSSRANAVVILSVSRRRWRMATSSSIRSSPTLLTSPAAP